MGFGFWGFFALRGGAGAGAVVGSGGALTGWVVLGVGDVGGFLAAVIAAVDTGWGVAVAVVVVVEGEGGGILLGVVPASALGRFRFMV